MTSELQYEIFSIYPNDAMKPNVLTEYKFKFGSIAGCVGNEINQKKKPGINEGAEPKSCAGFIQFHNHPLLLFYSDVLYRDVRSANIDRRGGDRPGNADAGRSSRASRTRLGPVVPR